MILCIESTTDICSVALVNNDGVVAITESEKSREHSRLLAVFVDDLLKGQDIKAEELEAVAVSRGPGSYTGLRIGASLAKGIAYSTGIPLIAPDTMLSLWHTLTESGGEFSSPVANRLYVPMIDARRMEVYCSVIDSQGNIVREVWPEIVTENSYSNLLEKQEVLFFGNGAAKCREVITHPNALFAEETECSARGMRIPAFRALREKKIEDTAYFEPFYLKEFHATVPKNLLP